MIFINLTLRKRAPSTAPVVAKLQQEPQMAWSFTGVTAPAEAELRWTLDHLPEKGIFCKHVGFHIFTVKPPVKGIRYFHSFVNVGREREPSVWSLSIFPSPHCEQLRHGAIWQRVEGQCEGQPCSVLGVDVSRVETRKEWIKIEWKPWRYTKMSQHF